VIEEPADNDLTPRRLEARVVLVLVHAGIGLVAFVALFLGAYPALIKFSPDLLATLAIPWRLSKGLEFALYVITFGVLLPAGLVTAGRQARALERRGVDPTTVALIDLVAITIVLAVPKIALAYAPRLGDPTRQLWVRPISWGVLLAMLVLVLGNVWVTRRPPSVLRSMSLGDRGVWALLAAFLAMALVFTPSWVFTARHALPAAAVALAVYGAWRLSGTVGRVSRRVGVAVDAIVVVLIALLVWDLRVEKGPLLASGTAHVQDIYIGPANAVLHGGTLLVDVFAQYGPGMTYFLAGLFRIVPIGYGPFWILVVSLDVVLFLLMFAIFRLAGATRVLAASGVVLAVLTGVLAKLGGETMVPNTPMRLLLPLFAVLLIQLAQRYPRRAVLPWALAIVVGISSIWALEVFLYTLAGSLAGLASEARLDAPEGRALRIDKRELLRVFGAIVAAQLLFAVATRVFSGQWPDWFKYLGYMHVYASGSGSQPLAPFKPGLLLGIFYFTSCAAAVVLLVWNRPYARERRRQVVSLCAVLGVAVAYFSYFAGQSQLGNVQKMAPISVMVIVLLLNLAGTDRGRTATAARAGIVFLTIWFVSLGLIQRHAAFVRHLERTALFASPSATIADFRFAASVPIVNADAPESIDFIRRTMGSTRKPLVLLPDQLTMEALMRMHETELLPISDPYNEALLPSRLAHLRHLAADLPVGTQFVSKSDYYQLAQQGVSFELGAQLLEVIGHTFVLRTDATGPHGLRVYRIVARR
jgi:hypothetical protein